MKLQAPTSKLQRSSKRPIAEGARIECVYPETGEDWGDRELREPEADERHPFDLEERTARFGESIIQFLKSVPRGPRNDRLIDQLVGSATGISANYCEANEGVSRKDFRNIIGRCKKEAKEAKFFLRMIAASEPGLAPEARALYVEAKELHLILCSIYRKTRPE